MISLLFETAGLQRNGSFKLMCLIVFEIFSFHKCNKIHFRFSGAGAVCGEWYSPAPGPSPAPAFDLRHTGDVAAVVGGVARLRCAVLHLAANTVSNSSIFTESWKENADKILGR